MWDVAVMSVLAFLSWQQYWDWIHGSLLKKALDNSCQRGALDPIDRLIGPQTANTLQRYEQAHGLSITGAFDAATCQALGDFRKRLSLSFYRPYRMSQQTSEQPGRSGFSRDAVCLSRLK